MDLNTLWFVLILVLFVGFFVLEGFDYGVGMLMPFLGKNDLERRVILNTIGPFWDGNEVWLLTAGGAMFAAFPMWYATMFSGFYLPLFLLLLALIVRGVGFEFRSKDRNPRWRSLWDWMVFIGSLVPALLIAVAFANLVRGVPIDGEMNYVGGFFNLLNPYALLGGVSAVLMFLLYGAIYLSLKTTDDLLERAQNAARRLWLPVVLVFLVFAVATYFSTDILSRLGVNPGVIPIAALIAVLLAGYFIRIRRTGWAFLMVAATIAFTISTLFAILYPRVMISSLNPAWSLTIFNASSTDYTLTIMTVVALIFVPIVLIYQGWTYWVFRKRVTSDPQALEY